MGFVYHPNFPTLECWADGDNICVTECDGSISKYPSQIRIETDKQLNLFTSPNVCWCLVKDGVQYVGLFDGTFSGYRESDGLLVRFGCWAYPFDREYPVVGQYYGSTVRLDGRDRRTLYIAYKPHVFLLHKPYVGTPLMPSICAARRAKLPGLLLYTQEGGQLNVKEAGTWVDTPTYERRGNPVEL